MMSSWTSEPAWTSSTAVAPATTSRVDHRLVAPTGGRRGTGQGEGGPQALAPAEHDPARRALDLGPLDLDRPVEGGLDRDSPSGSARSPNSEARSAGFIARAYRGRRRGTASRSGRSCTGRRYRAEGAEGRHAGRTHASAAGLELGDGGVEVPLAEVGPEGVEEHELGVGGLPREEVRGPVLARGADHQVHVRHVGGVEPEASTSSVTSSAATPRRSGCGRRRPARCGRRS